MSTSPTETTFTSQSVDGIARSVRVLVVDNDIVHARTMGEGLERLGYKVIVAGGGPYAGNGLWPTTLSHANEAYRTLIMQGNTKDRQCTHK